MFYNDNILTRKGPLANIWLAVHYDRRLTKTQIVGTNIETSIRDIVSGSLPPMALRLSGQLLLGVSKIYGRKARYLLEDCADAFSRLKVAFRPNNEDLPANSSKAAHSAITIPAAVNFDDALAPEPELDLDALLREPLPAQDTRQSNSLMMRRNANLDYEMGRVSFGLEQTKVEELPSEFQMDIEMGRRLSQNPASDTIDPLRESIEFGRHAESPRPSLPFSPLRSSIKNLDSLEFEQLPMNDDFGVFDKPAMPDLPENQFGNNSPLKRISDAPNLNMSPIATNVALKQSRQKRTKRRGLLLDDETEIPNAQLQEFVRDTAPITVAHLASENAFNEALKLLSISVPATTRNQHDELVEQVPLGDNDYLLGPADYEMDLPAPPSPKSPRLSRNLRQDVENQAEEENIIEDYNGVVPSAPETPSKSNRISRSASLTELPILADETLDALARWQGAFGNTSKKLSFESLIEAPKKRRQAADTFLQLLVLHTKDLIRVEQVVPYGDISVKPTANLFMASGEIISL